jgi:cytochrome P450
MTEALDSAPRPMPTERATFFGPPEELRGLPPISPLRFASGATGWLITGHAEARAVLADPRFSSARAKAESVIREMPKKFREQGAQPGAFISMDPPEHTSYRKLLTAQFTVRRMRSLEPRIDQIVTEHLDAMAAAGPTADLVTAFALPVPSLVICELLGVSYAQRAEFQSMTGTLLRLNSTEEELLASRDGMRRFMFTLVAAKRADPADDLISALINDTELTDEELVNIATLLLIAGHETTANMLALGTFALLQHPDQLRELRENPSLMPGAVEELLRYLTIVHFGLPRYAKADVEIGGTLVKEGQSVAISLPMANRDTALLDGADELDVSRERTHHLAFGHGVHQCLGQQLARIEMITGLRQLLARFPTLRLAVPPEEVPMRTDMAVYGVHSLPVSW